MTKNFIVSAFLLSAIESRCNGRVARTKEKYMYKNLVGEPNRKTQIGRQSSVRRSDLGF
jgi:hypothetical protein